MFFGLDVIDGIELVQVRQAQMVSLQAFDLLLKLLLHIVLFLGEPKVTNLELHPRIVDEDVGRFDVSMDEAFLMDVLESVDELLEEVEDHLPVDFVILRIQEFSQGVANAMFHLNHDVQGDEVLLFVDQLVQGAL